MNKYSDCKHRSLTTQWRYIKLFEWRCTAPKYTNDVGGEANYLTCTYIRNHDGMNECSYHCYSFEEK